MWIAQTSSFRPTLCHLPTVITTLQSSCTYNKLCSTCFLHCAITLHLQAGEYESLLRRFVPDACVRKLVTTPRGAEPRTLHCLTTSPSHHPFQHLQSSLKAIEEWFLNPSAWPKPQCFRSTRVMLWAPLVRLSHYSIYTQTRLTMSSIGCFYTRCTSSNQISPAHLPEHISLLLTITSTQYSDRPQSSSQRLTSTLRRTGTTATACGGA
jgi:hypothetical protein